MYSKQYLLCTIFTINLLKTGFRGRSESLTSKSGFKGANYHTPVNISVRKIGLGAEAGHRSEEDRRVERYSLTRLTGRK